MRPREMEQISRIRELEAQLKEAQEKLAELEKGSSNRKDKKAKAQTPKDKQT